MKNQIRTLTFAAIVVLCLAAMPLNATLVTAPFTVTIDGSTYPGFGGNYFGSVFYDDTDLVGFPGEFLSPQNGLIDLALTAPDPTGALVLYDETQDELYNSYPRLFFSGAGDPVALSWAVLGSPLTAPQIMWTDEFDETFNLATNADESWNTTVASGSIVFGSPVPLEIPEPATLALIGTGLGLLALIRKRGASGYPQAGRSRR